MTSLDTPRNSDGMGDYNNDVIGASTLTFAATTYVLTMGDTPRIRTSMLTEGDTRARQAATTLHAKEAVSAFK